MLGPLIIPAFIAGLFTFLAPCTLPLVPGYLGFISGVSSQELNEPQKLKGVRGKIFLNGLFYVLGFSMVFILMGTVFAAGGLLLAQYRLWLSRIGGVFVIFFGLYLMGVFRRVRFLNFLEADKHIGLGKYVKPGNPTSAFIFGATFAFGWTPCIGPVLGAILTLAASNATLAQGALLLGVFSLGLALPFLLIALGIGGAQARIEKLQKYLPAISFMGGLFLVALGYLVITDSLGVWFSYAYSLFNFINYDALLNFL